MFAARPPAKVNLTLEVGPLGDDGYHPLRSVFLRIGLSDRLEVQPAAAGALADRLTLIGLPGTPTEGNLVLKAFDALRTHASLDLPPLDVTLDKRIPSAAGLGGGSSDAASALLLSQVAWGVRVARAAELDLAASLGSDIPFFYFAMAAAEVRGRGEDVTPWASIFPGLGLLLVTPTVQLSTASVFARYDEIAFDRGPGPRVTDELLDVFLDEPTTNDVLGLADRLRDANDLWPAALSLEPSLSELRDKLESATNRPWLMSGSGSTLFALYPSAELAADAGRKLVRDHLTAIEGCLVHAVDLEGPDPAWRYP